MADSKITALTAISTVDPTADPLVIVDVSDTSMAASGTTKKSTINQLLGAGGTATLASATISGDLTAARLIVTGGTIPTNGLWLPTTNTLEFAANSLAQYRIAPLGVFSWYDGAGGTRMTLNATGLGVGVAPTTDCKLTVRGGSIFDRGVGGGSPQLLLSLAASSGGNYGQISNTGTRWALGFGGTLTTVGTEALVWDSSGNVGIGVTPSARFHSKAGAVTLGGIIETGGASSLLSFADTGTSSYTRVQIGSNGNNLVGMINGVQALTLDASGNLLVGRTTMAGSERLHIEGSVTSFVSRFSNTSATTPSGLFVRYSSAAPNGTGDFFVRCDDNVATRFELRSNGGLANYSANNVNLSDARTKTDIKPLISYWNKIKALELVTFKYKDQTHDDDNIGLISQQVESVAPEFVSNDGFGQTPADGVPLKGIYTTDLYHGAIKALQEAMTRIEVLEAKLA